MFSRRDTVLLVALVVVVGGLWLLLAPDDDEGSPGDPRLSSFHTSPNGARALYLTLQEVGVPTTRRLTSYPAGEAPATAALALLAPTEHPTPRELASLRSWVRSGGTLLYAARPGDPTLDTLGLDVRPLAPDSLSPLGLARWDGVPVEPRAHRWTEGLETTAAARYAFDASSPALSGGDATPLLTTAEGRPAAVVFRQGNGTVVAWSDPKLLSNRTLREGGRPLVFARAASEATADGDSVVFDEYHQGYRAGGGPVRATLRFVRRTAPGHAALQVAVAGLGLLLLLGRRFGAPVELRRGRRRSPLEHVDALSAAYRRADARSTVRRLLVAGLARRLGRSLPEDRSGTAFLERLADRLPGDRAEAERLLEEWKKGDGADLTVLARAVDGVVSSASGPVHRDPPNEDGE